MDWKDRIEVKKGDIGEQIVNDYLLSKGLIVYEPITEKAHGFDRLVSVGKERFVIVEIKTKAKRNKYPDTGIDYRHYIEYKTISEKHNLPVLLYFVDEMLGEIYGDRLDILERPNCYNYKESVLSYPKVEQYGRVKLIYFYQPTMKKIHTLTDGQIQNIKKYSSRSYA